MKNGGDESVNCHGTAGPQTSDSRATLTIGPACYDPASHASHPSA